MAVPRRFTWKDWLTFASPAAIVIDALIAGGQYIGQTKENTRRIAKLEERQEQGERSRGDDKEKLNTIDVRTARIESKLEILLPPQKVARP